jgi:hypothetical protein
MTGEVTTSFLVLTHAGAIKLGETLPTESLTAVTAVVAAGTTASVVAIDTMAHSVAPVVLFDWLVAPWTRFGVLSDPAGREIWLLYLSRVELRARLTGVHLHTVLNARFLSAT